MSENKNLNLRFEHRIKKVGKTEIVEVYSIHSGDFLGVIHWRPGWRMYVMSYAPIVDMSVDCHDELNDYMKILEGERNAANALAVTTATA